VYTLAITRVSTRTTLRKRTRRRACTSTYICRTSLPADDTLAESPAPDHHFRTSGPLVHSITRARFLRRFAGLSSSLTCRKIESRPVDFPATYAARRARADRRCASSSSSARVERARIGSVKDRPELPEPCRPSAGEVSVPGFSFFIYFYFVSRFSLACFPLLPSESLRAFVSGRSSDVPATSHSAMPYDTPRGMRANPILAVSRPNQRLKRLETGCPYKSAAATAVEAEASGKGRPL